MKATKKECISLKMQIKETLKDRTLEKSDRRYLREKLKRINDVIKELEKRENVVLYELKKSH